MSINSHTNNANLLSEMAGNENSPSVGLDLYNEASFHLKIFLYACQKSIRMNGQHFCRPLIIVRSPNWQEV